MSRWYEDQEMKESLAVHSEVCNTLNRIYSRKFSQSFNIRFNFPSANVALCWWTDNMQAKEQNATKTC